MAGKAALRVGIAGASGLTGGELMSILLGHPLCDVVYAGALGQVGRFVSECHPSLERRTRLVCQGQSPDAIRASGLDCLFMALPHCESMKLVPHLEPGLRIVDLSGDYRLRDAQQFAQHYGQIHADAGGWNGFVYGLSEIARGKIREARRIANPGCFATAAILSLYPLVSKNLIGDSVFLSGVTGSSGAGTKLSPTTHHPHRAEAFAAYKVFKHQHEPEILQALNDANPNWAGDLVFQTHTAPMVRGIYMTAHLRLNPSSSEADVADAFAAHYADAPLVRMRREPPDSKWVRGTPFADLSWSVRGRNVLVFVALDNLMKGAASQAVQNLNIMLGWDETLGLTHCFGGGV